VNDAIIDMDVQQVKTDLTLLNPNIASLADADTQTRLTILKAEAGIYFPEF
jgi:hypothetical protein